MIKIINKKKWELLVELTECEIDKLEAQIYVSERYIDEYYESPDRQGDLAYLRKKLELQTRLPILINELATRKQILKLLKEV